MTDPATARQGLIHDLAEAAYHSGPELSVSGAKDLLRAPALYKHNRTNPVHKDAFDLGSVVHTLVLGTGWPYVVIDADDWRGKAAREARDQARAAGQTPLLRKDFQTAEDMAEQVLSYMWRPDRDSDRRVPLRDVFGHEDGAAEVSMFWTETASDGTPVPCRARVDYLHPAAMLDVKTARDASLSGFQSSAGGLYYDVQAAAYRRALTAITGELAPPFNFVAVEKEPPFLVGVREYGMDDLSIGERVWLEAVDLWARCTNTDEWPGYSDTTEVITLPRWRQ